MHMQKNAHFLMTATTSGSRSPCSLSSFLHACALPFHSLLCSTHHHSACRSSGAACGKSITLQQQDSTARSVLLQSDEDDTWCACFKGCQCGSVDSLAVLPDVVPHLHLQVGVHGMLFGDIPATHNIKDHRCALSVFDIVSQPQQDIWQ